VSFLFLTGKKVTHLGGPPGLMPTLGCPAGGAVSMNLKWGQFISKNLARDLGIQEVKDLLLDNSPSTHDLFLRKKHFKIRKGN